MKHHPRLISASLVALGLAPSTALAQSSVLPGDSSTGAAPADAKALVAAPTGSATAPTFTKSPDNTTATVSAGGQLATGNSQLLAGTANGKLDLRRGDWGFGASLLANYGQGATSPDADQHVTAENIQARVRIDYYVSDVLSIFLIDTERHDRFQGLALRTNIDPGLKYLFYKSDATSFWGEVGYDFQYDVRLESALPQVDGSGNPVLVNGQQVLLDKTATSHSGRLFAGLKHAFNTQVTFTTGLEYLQAFAASSGSNTDYRLNYDALFAANVGGGLALGLGFSARYDHDPLPGKKNLDTATTASLIYSFNDPPPKPTEPMCPCAALPPAPPPPPPPPSAPPPPPAPPSAAPAPTPQGT